MHEGNVVSVKGRIMREPKASTLSAQAFTTLPECTNSIMHKNWYIRNLVLPETAIGICKVCMYGHM